MNILQPDDHSNCLRLVALRPNLSGGLPISIRFYLLYDIFTIKYIEMSNIYYFMLAFSIFLCIDYRNDFDCRSRMK